MASWEALSQAIIHGPLFSMRSSIAAEWRIPEEKCQAIFTISG